MEFKPPYVLVRLDPIKERLGQLIGDTVSVTWVPDINALKKHPDFCKISMQGKLAGSAEKGRYRVVLDDNNYTYFFPENVWSLGQDINKRPVIFIDHEKTVELKKEATRAHFSTIASSIRGH